MLTVGVLGSFLAGVLALISPCSALLLPAFFAYAFTSVRQLVAKTGVFFLGLLTVLVPLGLGVGQIFTLHRTAAITVGGIVLIALGIFIALGGGFNIPWLHSAQHRGSTFVLGLVYGFAGFCAGPLLGAVLTTAAVSGSALYGALIMAAYAAGLAAPLLVLALLWDSLADASWLTRFSTSRWWRVTAGLIFVGIGLLFLLSHGTARLPGWLSLDVQEKIQTWVLEHTGGINDLWVIGTLLVLCVGTLLWLLRRR